MKALILSVSAGGGHNKAAEAIKESIIRNEPDSEVKIINTIEYISPMLDKLVIGTYLKSIKYYPVFFKYLYRVSDDREVTSVTKLAYEFISKQLLPTIDEMDPDVVIVTHPFTAQILSLLIRRYGFTRPTCAVMTDYGAHSFWIHGNIDAYVVSNEDMVEELMKRGVDQKSIFPYGIPVNQGFHQTRERSEILRELGLKDKKTITVVGGSLGIGNIVEIVKEILSIDKDFQLVVVAGGNRKLHASITELVADCDKEVLNLSYTKNMNEILKITDLLVTKPGGLTLSESFIAGTPMVIFSAIYGQETQNADYLLRHRLAVDIGSGYGCREKVEELLSDDITIQRMKNRAREYAKPNAAQDVFLLLKKLIQDNSKMLIK